MKKNWICFIALFLVWSSKARAAYEVDIQLSKSQYTVGLSSEDENFAQQKLAGLDENERQSFFSTRAEFLRLAAIAFQKLKWGFGVGAIIKNKISFYRDQKNIRKHFVLAQTLDNDEKQALISSVLSYEEKMLAKQNEFKQLNFKEKADEVILKLLFSLDHSLWEGAPIVSRANEFGVMGALGPQLEFGAAEGKKWGGLFDIGISLGFNRDQKALVVQVFRDKEKYVSTQMPAIFIAGLVVKAGLTVANQKKELTTEGLSYYPPMTPGFSTMTDRSFNVGFSSGMTWPPTPLGDILTYSNSSQRRIWLRLTFSPVQKGFLNLAQGFGEETKELARIFRKGSGAVACEALFQ